MAIMKWQEMIDHIEMIVKEREIDSCFDHITFAEAARQLGRIGNRVNLEQIGIMVDDSENLDEVRGYSLNGEIVLIKHTDNYGIEYIGE